MYVILGASGHTGQIVAKSLLARGQKVRVVYLATDGSVFINFQTQGSWGVYGGLD